MQLHETYDYLTRARRDLWRALGDVPEELLARPLLVGERFHCIKDLLCHIPAVEDGWLHEDILRVPSLWQGNPALRDTTGGHEYATVPLDVMLAYWRDVEHAMLRYLPTLTNEELQRVVTVHDAPEERFTVDAVLTHVMLHEVRHTAQVCALLRTQGVKPPSLDLYFYLPR
jgi:uncharacterized damage-inducible protein DinB